MLRSFHHRHPLRRWASEQADEILLPMLGELRPQRFCRPRFPRTARKLEVVGRRDGSATKATWPTTTTPCCRCWPARGGWEVPSYRRVGEVAQTSGGARKPINRGSIFCGERAELPRPKPHQRIGLLDPPYRSTPCCRCWPARGGWEVPSYRRVGRGRANFWWGSQTDQSRLNILWRASRVAATEAPPERFGLLDPPYRSTPCFGAGPRGAAGKSHLTVGWVEVAQTSGGARKPINRGSIFCGERAELPRPKPHQNVSVCLTHPTVLRPALGAGPRGAAGKSHLTVGWVEVAQTSGGARKPINRGSIFCGERAELPRPKPHQRLGLLDPPYRSTPCSRCWPARGGWEVPSYRRVGRGRETSGGARKPINRGSIFCGERAELPRPKPHQTFRFARPTLPFYALLSVLAREGRLGSPILP